MKYVLLESLGMVETKMVTKNRPVPPAHSGAYVAGLGNKQPYKSNRQLDAPRAKPRDQLLQFCSRSTNGRTNAGKVAVTVESRRTFRGRSLAKEFQR
ncbi:hypothetical protein CQ018_09080 [Arthrobacter sp. MYb227]|nr:hypothetical protein CQ018_09080 [Arthrobacter sp. MYb227]